MNRTQYQYAVHFIHFAAVAVTLVLIVLLLPGFHLETSFLGLLFVSAVFAVLTIFVKPAFEDVVSPLLILYGGITSTALNTLMLYMTEVLTDGIFSIDNFWWALLGGAIVGVISGLVSGPAEIVRKRVFNEYRDQRRASHRSRMEEMRQKALDDDRFKF